MQSSVNFRDDFVAMDVVTGGEGLERTLQKQRPTWEYCSIGQEDVDLYMHAEEMLEQVLRSSGVCMCVCVCVCVCVCAHGVQIAG